MHKPEIERCKYFQQYGLNSLYYRYSQKAPCNLSGLFQSLQLLSLNNRISRLALTKENRELTTKNNFYDNSTRIKIR
jgi:hypothetical protein